MFDIVKQLGTPNSRTEKQKYKGYRHTEKPQKKAYTPTVT